MILSHSRKFVFIKTRKTGGTSVEIALSQTCGPADVITPLTPRDEKLRLSLGPGARNYSTIPTAEAEYLESLRRDNKLPPMPRGLKRAQTFFNHMPVSDVLSLVPGIEGNYLVVSIERHPYDKAVSLANWLIGAKNYSKDGRVAASPHALAEKLDQILDRSNATFEFRNWDLYTHAGRYVVDHMLRYETLHVDFANLCHRLGVSAERDLPRTKVGDWHQGAASSELLSPSQKHRIQEVCRDEFDHFGYPT